METKKFKTVEEYFGSVPPVALERMNALRKEIKETAPLAEEVISYNMPALKYKGVLVYYAAYDKHIGFYAVPHTHKAFEKELSEYRTGKGSVQFPHDRPLPMDLVKRMVKFRYEEKTKEG